MSASTDPPADLAALRRAPRAVSWIVSTLEDAGYETWTVGGAVRDVLAGIPTADWDFATRARPRQVRRVFRRTVPIGVEHGTVGVLARDGTLYEVTTFRRDVETYGRRARVEFSDSVEDDLARRDFTVNAIAWHPLREELLDPFGGAGDLEAGVLRTVGDPGERFREDYLRVLRAVRFASRFRMDVEPDTWTALCAATGELGILSPERLREELVKVLSADPRPSGALALYGAAGILAAVFPELDAPGGALAGGEGEGDGERSGAGGGAGDPRIPRSGRRPAPGSWSYRALLADVVPRHRPLLRLAALLQGARPDAAEAARSAAALMTRLRFSNADTDGVVGLVGVGTDVPDPGAGGADLRRWLHRADPGRLPDLTRLWVARARLDRTLGRAESVPAPAAWRALRAELGREPPLAVGDLALDGRDLIRMGLRPGPRFGEILDDLLERVLEEPSLNEPEALESLVREHPAAREAGRG